MTIARNPVEKKEIIEYLRLRIGRLKEGTSKGDSLSKLILTKRMSELDRLLMIISTDTIRKEVKKMKRHIYVKKKMEKNGAKLD